MPKFIVAVVDAACNPIYEITARSSDAAQRIAAERYQEDDYARPFFSTITVPKRKRARR